METQKEDRSVFHLDHDMNAGISDVSPCPFHFCQDPPPQKKIYCFNVFTCFIFFLLSFIKGKRT